MVYITSLSRHSFVSPLLSCHYPQFLISPNSVDRTRTSPSRNSSHEIIVQLGLSAPIPSRHSSSYEIQKGSSLSPFKIRRRRRRRRRRLGGGNLIPSERIGHTSIEKKLTHNSIRSVIKYGTKDWLAKSIRRQN